MTIPSQVKQQAEEADKLVQQHYDPESGKRRPPGEANEPGNPKTTESGAKPAAQASGDNDPENYKARFAGLKRTHDQLVSDHKQTVEQNTLLQQQLAEVSERLKKLEEAGPKAPAVDPSKDMVQRLLDSMTPEERDNYDDGFIQMIGRFFTQAAANQQPATSPELEKRVDNLETKQAKTDQDIFWEQVNNRVSDWQELQNDELFGEWADKYNPLIKATGWQGLAYAQKNNDYELAIGIFEQFKAVTATPITTGGETDVGGEDTGLTQDPRFQQISPASGGAETPLGDEGPTFKQSEIDDFYKKVSLGHYKGQEEWVKQRDKEIFEAGQAGRVLPG